MKNSAELRVALLAIIKQVGFSIAVGGMSALAMEESEKSTNTAEKDCWKFAADRLLEIESDTYGL